MTPPRLCAETRRRVRAIAAEIQAWRENDDAGYSEAIGLLCKAEDALNDAADALGREADRSQSDLLVPDALWSES